MSNKEIKIIKRIEKEQNPFYDKEKALSGDGLCYSQPLVKIEFSYDNKKYILVYDDTGYSDLESRWCVYIIAEGVKINKMLFFYDCDFIEDDIEHIKVNDYFKKELYGKFLSNEELGKYFPQESIEDIKERIDNRRTKTKIRRIKRDRENKLAKYLKEKDETLKDILIISESQSVSIKVFKELCTSVMKMIEPEALNEERYFTKLRSEMISYMVDIYEIMGSNNPELIGNKYYYDTDLLKDLRTDVSRVLTSNDYLDLIIERLINEVKQDKENTQWILKRIF